MPSMNCDSWIQPGGVKHHGDTAVEFEYYVDRASNRTAKRMGSNSHQLGMKINQPLLKKGRMNRILLYIGAFNPPHRGHMLVLHHGYRDCGKDFNVVAAIVLLKDDKYLGIKNRYASRNLLFDSKERHALWSTDVQFPDWAWTLSEDDAYFSKEDDTNIPLWQEIPKLAKADGFDVEFVRLLGPDNFAVRYDKWYEPRGHSYNTTLVSTAARAMEEYNNVSGPRKLNNFSVWVPVTSSQEAPRNATQPPSWLYTDVEEEEEEEEEDIPSAAPKANGTRIWQCHLLEDPKINTRFLYIPPATPDCESREMISSTKIHTAISTATKTESTQFIDEYALGPEFLKQQLARRDDGTHAKALELQEAEKEMQHLAFEETNTALDLEECLSCGQVGCNCKYRQLMAKQRVKRQLEAVGPAFEDIVKPTFRTKEELRKARTGAGKSSASARSSSATSSASGTSSASEKDGTEADMAFEDTMRLRVPSKGEEAYKPEYRNANRWQDAR